MSGEKCPWQGSVSEAGMYDCQLGPSYEEMYQEEQAETPPQTEKPQVEEE